MAKTYTLTLFEACEYLNRSKKTITRYVRAGRLHPQRAKSQQGTLEYRFSKEDLNAFKATESEQEAPKSPRNTPRLLKSGQGQTGQTRQDRTDKGGHYQQGTILRVLNETAEMLKAQLTIKDKQIETLHLQVNQLIERDRETNIILKGLQDRFLLLPDKTGQDTQDRQDTGGTDQTKRGKKVRNIVIAVSLFLILTAFFIYLYH